MTRRTGLEQLAREAGVDVGWLEDYLRVAILRGRIARTLTGGRED